MNHYEALPPDYNGQRNVADTPPAIVQDIPADQDPTKWEENLNQCVEDLGYSVAELGNAKREAEENEERINALKTETGENLNGD